MTILAIIVAAWLLTFPAFRLVLAFAPESPTKNAVCTAFFLIAFNPVILAPILPIPLMRIVYLALGARIGARSYGGTLLDPHLTTIGDDCLLSRGAVVSCHAIEHGRRIAAPITIGDRVTIGINAIVLPGVVVGNDAIIAAGAVVTKGTHVPDGTTWAGVPATQLVHQKASGLAARPEVVIHERRRKRRNRTRAT